MNSGYGFFDNEWIEDSRIKTELRLLLKISSLTAEKGYCWASNDYLANYFKTTTVTISKQIKKLADLGYISVTYKRKGAEITNRELRLKKTLTDDYQKLKPSIKENFKENSISNINNISNYIYTNPPLTEYHKFCIYLEENCTTIFSSKKLQPVTDKQYTKLRISYTVDQIERVCLNMENFRGLEKKYKSTYLVINNWLSRENKEPKEDDSDNENVVGNYF